MCNFSRDDSYSLSTLYDPLLQSSRGYDGLGEFGGGAGHGGQGGVTADAQKAGLYYDDVRHPALPGSASRKNDAILAHGGGYINITATTTRLDGTVFIVPQVFCIETQTHKGSKERCL